MFDEQEEPIIGANIYWEGTQQGTTSDADGYFELKGKENSEESGRQLYRVHDSGCPGRGYKQAPAHRAGWRSRFAGSRDQRAQNGDDRFPYQRVANPEDHL